MTPALRSLAVALAAGVLVASATRPVHALGPSVLMFYGGAGFAGVRHRRGCGSLRESAGSLERAAEGHGRSLVSQGRGVLGTRIRPRAEGHEGAGRSSGRTWRGSMGRYYPATATQPAVLVVTPLHVKRASGLPDFEHAALFSWGGALSPGAASAAQAATASVRVSHR